MLVFEPFAPSSNEAHIESRTFEKLSGKVVGFIDNAKPNFDHLVDDLSAILMRDYGVASVVKRRKRGPGIPAPAAVMDELTAQCDLVITGSGD